MHTEEHSRGNPAGVLTIAGSDSGGAAGLQADLKTFTALGVYGMSVVTVVTAQNSAQVAAVHTLPARLVAQQIDTVLNDYPVGAVKTGFTGRVELVAAIAARLRHHQARNLVVDPVLVNHRGQAMFAPEVTGAYREHLFPLARIITPNVEEAALLTGREVMSPDDLAAVAALLAETGTGAVLVTGFPAGNQLVDAFHVNGEIHFFAQERLETENVHGSGDTLSAAIAAFLAQGYLLPDAVRMARQYTWGAIFHARHWRLGAGHGPLNHFHIHQYVSEEKDAN